jgi:DNA repair exonuclease SbcCD ATPase subunit
MRMMLLWARVVNACQHVDKRVDFGPGITAIVGANGAGKSNFMHLVRCSVTNDFSALPGSKEDNIRRDAEPHEPSFIESCWQTAAGTVLIRRALRNAVSSISLGGDEIDKATGREREITSKATELLGVNAEVFNDFMFSDFNSLQEVIRGAKAQRARLFTSLYGVSVIDRVNELLRLQLSADQAVVNEFDATEFDTLMSRWRVIKSSMRAAKHAITKLEAELLPEEDLAELNVHCEELVKADTAYEEAVRDNRTTKDRLRKNVAALAAAKAYLQEATARQQWVGESAAAVRDCVNQLQQESRNVEARRKAAARLKSANAVLESSPPKFSLSKPCDVEQVRSQSVAIAQSIVAVQAEIGLIGEANQGICPTCKSPIDVSPEHLAELKVQLPELVAERNKLNVLLKSYQAYEKSKREFDTAVLLDNQRREEARKVVDELSSESFDALPDATLNKKLSRRQRQLTDYSAIGTELSNSVLALRDSVTTLTERIKVDRQVEQRNTAVIQIGRPEQSAIQDIKSMIAAHWSADQSLREQQFMVGRLAKEAIDLTKQLRVKSGKRRKVKRLTACVDIMRRSREVCGKDRLPARVVNGMLSRTAARVNKILRQLSAGFQVAVDPENFAFIVIHSDGCSEVAGRLSTGQGLMLGIAFWLARVAMFTGELPLFCLDEPTAHIDAGHLVDISNMFGRLAEELYQGNRQGVVITHHSDVAMKATRCFEFGEAYNAK